MKELRKALKRIRKQADKAALMIDIGPTSDKEWELCATAARTTVPALLDLADAVLERHVKAQPITAAYGTQEGGDYCAACAEDWPCPDYTAATTALERATDARA